VLAGFPGLPWGQLGAGPTPPSLYAIITALMVPPDLLEEAMDKLFRLHTAAPAQLRQGGELRPAVAIAFASLLMYYDERKAAGEMREVLIAMEEVLREVHTARGLTVNVPGVISEWGKLIKSGFDTANLRLTHQQSDTASIQVRNGVVFTTVHCALYHFERFVCDVSIMLCVWLLNCLGCSQRASCCVDTRLCSSSPPSNAWRTK